MFRTDTVRNAPEEREQLARPLLTRRRLEIALGCLWLLDGLLQFQPFMFTRAFFQDILGMANMGLPGPISSLDYRVADLLGAHFIIWNGAFATLQVLIGIGLLRTKTANLARAVSIPWGISVWLLGEGFGGMFMHGTNLMNGAPGAALLYSIIAIVLWPRRDPAEGPSAVQGAPGGRFARGAWAVIWCTGALLEVESINHAATVPGAQLSNVGEGEPSVLAWLNHAAGSLVGSHGVAFAVLLGVAACFVGLGALAPSTRRLALGLGCAMAVLFFVVGQDFGGVFTGQGTDPGSGPLLILFALTMWPRRAVPTRATRKRSAARSTTRRSRRPSPCSSHADVSFSHGQGSHTDGVVRRPLVNAFFCETTHR